MACSDPGTPADMREWRPEDHGQPTEVDPSRVAAEPTPAQAADPTRAAQALWKVACAGCHGLDGRGAGPSLPPGANVPVMTDASWQSERSDEQIAEVIRHGRNLMPPFGKQITDDGIKALVAHIRSLRR
jgi:mono/diheme cytochrome c family protein